MTKVKLFRNLKYLEYVSVKDVSKKAIEKLEKEKGIKENEIKKVAFYKRGSYHLHPLIFFTDKGIYKISSKKSKLYIEKIN